MTPSDLYPMSRSTSSESILTTVPATRLPSSNSMMVASIASANDPSRSLMTTWVSSSNCCVLAPRVGSVSTADAVAVSSGSPARRSRPVPGPTLGILLCSGQEDAPPIVRARAPRRSGGAASAKATGHALSRRKPVNRASLAIWLAPSWGRSPTSTTERDAELGRVAASRRARAARPAPARRAAPRARARRGR